MKNGEKIKRSAIIKYQVKFINIYFVAPQRKNRRKFFLLKCLKMRANISEARKIVIQINLEFSEIPEFTAQMLKRFFCVIF